MISRLFATLAGLSVLAMGSASSAASFRTQHFIVSAASLEVAEQVGTQAERWRSELALAWLGHELPPSAEQCALRVFVRPKSGASGETSFEFVDRRPTKIRMTVVGPLETLLDSILPHEVCHLIFATHFGLRLPPWVDEGACTIVESEQERTKLRKAARKVFASKRRLTIDELLALRKYPKDIVPVYTQGHALSSFLIERGGKRKFIAFIRDAVSALEGLEYADSTASDSRLLWNSLVDKHYHYNSLEQLESSWIAWVQDDTFLPQKRQPEIYVASMVDGDLEMAMD